MEKANDNRRRNRIIGGLFIVIGIVILLLWLRGCREEPKPEPPEGEEREKPYLIPRHLALKFDRDGILDYCRKEIRPASYEGILRGPHGALWAGEANAWDRVLLAAAALEAEGVEALVVPGDPPRLAHRDGAWHTVRLDAAAATETTEQPPPQAFPWKKFAEAQPELVHEINSAFRVVFAGGDSERRGGDDGQPLAEWLRLPAVVEAKPGDGGVEYQLLLGDRLSQHSGQLSNAVRVELELTWRFRDRAKTWRRELYDQACKEPGVPGRPEPRAGDRYAVVVAAGPLVEEVPDTRKFMLYSKLDTPLDDGPARTLIEIATKYQVESDERTRALAKETKVAVSWHEPRITIAGWEMPLPDPDGKVDVKNAPPALSLDALADAVEAEGKEGKTFHIARGFANDTIETLVLHRATKERILSATSILSHFKAPSAEAPDRRIDAIEAEAKRLLAEEPIGTRVTLQARPPSLAENADAKNAQAKDPPSLTIERGDKGLALRGLGEDPKIAKGPVWSRYSWQDAHASLPFASDSRALAVIADVMLARRIGFPDYALHFEVKRGWPEELPLAAGSMLSYRVAGTQDKEKRLMALVTLKEGRPVARWFDPATGAAIKQGAIAWQPVLPPGSAPKDVEIVPHALEVGDDKWVVQGRAVPLKLGKVAGRAVVLDDPAWSVLLSWQGDGGTVELEKISAVARGRLIDQDTGAPVAHAKVARGDVLEEVRAGADGSFTISAAPPLFRRVLLLLDKSGSMRLKLKTGESRLDALRKAATELFDRWPVGLEVAVWTYSFDEVKVECDFTKDIAVARKAVEGIEPGGATPLASAISKATEHVAKLPFPEHTLVLLMADGENTEPTPAAKAYRAAKTKVLLHTVGFAIEPGSQSEKELTEVAQLSGGTFQRAAGGAALASIFQRLGESLAGLRLRVSSTCHAPAEVTLPTDELKEPLEPIRLVHGCADCKCGDKKLFTINQKNLADLERCEGLSPRAKRLIRERLADEGWSVTIPSQRVAVGAVTAYGWLETEKASGRVVGRTEDGLHGASAGASGFPPFQKGAGDLPFVAWYTGIVVYTAGSVDAMLRWHKQPNFLSHSPDDLKRFVQAHALEFAAGWWSEVGSQSFPENVNSYWSGVCMNYVLQSAALGLPNDRCHRRWGETLCNDAADVLKGFPGEKADQFLDENLGETWRSFIKEAFRRGFKDLADEMKKTWDDGVDQGFDCKRLRGEGTKKTSRAPAGRLRRLHELAAYLPPAWQPRGERRHTRDCFLNKPYFLRVSLILPIPLSVALVRLAA